jgi:hypothetical protein
MEVAGSWKTARCCGSKKRVHGYNQAANNSMDTARLYRMLKKYTV